MLYFPGGSNVKKKKSACQDTSPGFYPWVRKIPWRRKWQPTPVFLPRKSHGQRSLAGCSPWGHKESDTAEWLKQQEHSNYVPDVWGQGWAPSSLWPTCVYPWLRTTPTLPLWLTQAEPSVLNPHPRSFRFFKCYAILQVKVKFYLFQAVPWIKRVSPFAELPSHPRSSACVCTLHDRPPPFRSVSRGSKFQ